MQIQALLWETGRFQQEVRLCEELVERFQEPSDPWLRQYVLGALTLVADACARLGQRPKALDTYEQIVSGSVTQQSPSCRSRSSTR